MTPIYMARNLADDRIRELLADADRRRLLAVLPAEPGRLQRFAFLVAGWGRLSAVVTGHLAVVRSAYEPSAT